LPPGPISNYTLLAKSKNNEVQVKPNLKINEDYRGVNKYVWDMLYRHYGGGPVIVRESLDIYSHEPIAIQSDSVVKA